MIKRLICAASLVVGLAVAGPVQAELTLECPVGEDEPDKATRYLCAGAEEVPTFAGPKAVFMEHLAHILAFSRYCGPRIRQNDELFQAIHRVMRISTTEGSGDFEVVERRAAAIKAGIEGIPEGMVCAVAIIAYGPTGIAIPGIFTDQRL